MPNFLPDSYKIPKTPSNYFKFEQGDNKFRVLSSAIVGYEYFTADNKPVPVRQKEPFTAYPEDIKFGEQIKPFWAFVVWNYQLKMVQILELTQKGIMAFIKKQVDNPKWGDPKQYDIIVNRIGEGLNTSYVITTDPHSPVSEEIAAAFMGKIINLEALYQGDNPFKH